MSKRDASFEEVAKLYQSILDADGYIVLGGYEQLPIGHVFPRVVSGMYGGLIDLQTVIVAEATAEEYKRQWMKHGPNKRFRCEHAYYYKVIAE